jgi:hypothetical protein
MKRRKKKQSQELENYNNTDEVCALRGIFAGETPPMPDNK